jgi:hypothetical protein
MSIAFAGKLLKMIRQTPYLRWPSFVLDSGGRKTKTRAGIQLDWTWSASLASEWEIENSKHTY